MNFLALCYLDVLSDSLIEMDREQTLQLLMYQLTSKFKGNKISQSLWQPTYLAKLKLTFISNFKYSAHQQTLFLILF